MNSSWHCGMHSCAKYGDNTFNSLFVSLIVSQPGRTTKEGAGDVHFGWLYRSTDP